MSNRATRSPGPREEVCQTVGVRVAVLVLLGVRWWHG
jgi:hypothetical protein